jgi:hypothetical protein
MGNGTWAAHPLVVLERLVQPLRSECREVLGSDISEVASLDVLQVVGSGVLAVAVVR